MEQTFRSGKRQEPQSRVIHSFSRSFDQATILRPLSTMEADITVATEVNRLEHVSQSDLATRLPLLFAKILDPNLEARLVYSYVVSTR
jgi:hypothetical protein